MMGGTTGAALTLSPQGLWHRGLWTMHYVKDRAHLLLPLAPQ